MKNKLKVILTILSIIVMTFMYSIVSYADELTTSSSEEKNASLSIGTVEIEDIKDIKEVKVPVKIEKIESLCSGTIVIDCGCLEFVGLENKNDSFNFESAQSDIDKRVTVSFSGSSGIDGDIDLVSLKFKLPEKVENNQTFLLYFSDSTSLSTIKTASIKYTVSGGEINVKKGNYNKLSTATIFTIILGVVTVILFIIALKEVFSKKNSGSKKVLKSLILLLLAIIAGIGCYKFAKDGSLVKHKEIMDENEATMISKYKYETLLNIADGSYLNFENEGESQAYKIYKFDNKNYVKIKNSEMVNSSITDEYKDEFFKICGIIEKDGNYFMKQDKVGREKDLSYTGSSIKTLEFSDNEIKAEVSNTYSNYVENKINTIKQSFVLKKIGNDWKVNEFTLPY